MSMTNLPRVTVYTDGGCKPNPGPGGWGAVLLFDKENRPQELLGGDAKTTNNRMELQAALETVRALPVPHHITLYTDSKYLKNGITKWLDNWRRKNWVTSGGTPVKNKDLWQALSRELGQHQIEWRWTKGHAGDRWNERADQLATAGIRIGQKGTTSSEAEPETSEEGVPLYDENAIHIFTAASYLHKSKKGGWGATLLYRQHRKSLSGGAESTSAHRMYIQGAIEGLRALKKPMPIHLYTTSDYLKDGATTWYKNWQKRNWITKGGKPVSHRDLWQELIGLTERYNVTWHVVDRNARPEEMMEAKELASQQAKGG